MRELPILHLTNWSSPKLHGPGRKLGIMAMPRNWEQGKGRVMSCAPEVGDLRAVRSTMITIDEYRRRMEQKLHTLRDILVPGALSYLAWDTTLERVEGGDTLLCACSKEAASKGECHRVWVAAALALAGWRVVLDGVEVSRC